MNHCRYLAVYISLIIVGFLAMLYQCTIATYLPYDDVYTLSLIAHSFSEIVSITAGDVHPPLYYCLLKLYSLVMGNNLIALRMFSLLGVLAIVALGGRVIRRRVGLKSASVFVLLLFCFPTTQNLAVDVRMYSWLAFFVFATGIQAYRVCERGSKWNYTVLTLLALCAIYMHNYGLIATGWIYILLLIAIRRSGGGFAPVLISASVLLLLYAPWMYALVGQLVNVNNEYWIQSLTLADLNVFIYYFYSTKILELPFDFFSKLSMLLVIVVALLPQCILWLRAISQYIRQRGITIPILCLMVFVLTVFSALLFSLTLFPILVPRYMLAVFPFLVLGLALLVNQSIEGGKLMQYCGYSVLIAIVGLGTIRYVVCMQDYLRIGDENKKVRQFAAEDSESVGSFLANGNGSYSLGVLQYRYPEANCIQWLDDEKYADMTPFVFQQEKRMADLPIRTTYIIPIHPNFRELKSRTLVLLKKNYIIVDSLSTTDCYLYKLNKKSLGTD